MSILIVNMYDNKTRKIIEINPDLFRLNKSVKNKKPKKIKPHPPSPPASPPAAPPLMEATITNETMLRILAIF